MDFFSSALSEASNSILGNANLISKVYFPRLIVPMAAVGVALVDFYKLCDADRADDLVSLCAQLADGAAAHFCGAGILRQPRAQFMADRTQYQISGYTIYHSVYRSVWTLHISGRLQFERGAGKMAATLFFESRRRRH